jgi:hypothetical protein
VPTCERYGDVFFLHLKICENLRSSAAKPLWLLTCWEKET